MRKVIAAMGAAAVLVAGAFVASVITTDPADAQTTTTTNEEVRPDVESDLDEVLGGLVADGTITQDQADAVKEALVAKHEERKAEREARRDERRADRELIRGFLDDGVIDADELAQLGDDHPFNDPDGPFADAAADGEITTAELRELHVDRHQHRFHAGDMGDDGVTGEGTSA